MSQQYQLNQNLGVVTERYDGTSWTEVNDLNSGRRLLITTGTATAALSFGGNTPDTAKTEIWNGSTWTETGDLNRYTKECGGVAADNTAAIAIAGSKSGSPENDSRCETWNGSAWTEVNDL